MWKMSGTVKGKSECRFWLFSAKFSGLVKWCFRTLVELSTLWGPTWYGTLANTVDFEIWKITLTKLILVVFGCVLCLGVWELIYILLMYVWRGGGGFNNPCPLDSSSQQQILISAASLLTNRPKFTSEKSK